MPTHAVRQREWIKADEVADLLGVSIHTVNSWRLRSKGPPCYRLNSAVRYDRAEVVEWHEAHRHEGGGR